MVTVTSFISGTCRQTHVCHEIMERPIPHKEPTNVRNGGHSRTIIHYNSSFIIHPQRGEPFIDHMTMSMKMEKDQSHVTERIINLTLEILCLLTGERFSPVKFGDQVTITVPPLHPLTPERNHKEKILEVTRKMMELLTGEEWEYLGGHRDLYKDVVMENEPPLTSPAGEYDVLNSSEEYPTSTLDDHTVSRGINGCSPEGKYSVGDVPQRLILADRSAGPPTDRFHSSSPHLYSDRSADALNSENPFKKLHAITLNILQRTHDGGKTADPFHLKEPSYANSDVPLHKGEKIIPNSNDKKSSTSSPTLTGHQKANAADRPYSCSECGKSFNTKSHLVFHKKIHSGVRPYLCTECGKRFICKSHLTRHVSQHTGVRPYSCPECAKSFIGKADLVSHLRYHTGERPFVCTECGQSFMQSGHLRRHLRIHTGERPFSCTECGKCFSWKDTLIKHQRTHMGKKVYTCRTCEKEFPLRGMLIIHQRAHTGEQPAKSEALKTKPDLQEHGSDDTDGVTFSCAKSEGFSLKITDFVKCEDVHSTEEPSEQGKGFSPDSQIKAEPEDKPFSCPECGKCYSQKRQLLTHQRTHRGELPFKCSECGKGFNEKRYLLNHQSIHTGERAFSCSDCGKSFTWKESLIRHKKFHSGVRPYSCSDCGKSFTLKGDLLRHQRTHTDKLLYSCSECGKSFRLKKYLLKHQKSHAGERPFSCSDCGKFFTRRDSLYRHMRNHFGEP